MHWVGGDPVPPTGCLNKGETPRWKRKANKYTCQCLRRTRQKDEDSLPSYAVLDPILEAYIEEDSHVEEMLAAGMPPAAVEQTIRLVDRSEYKRRQAPPGVKITPRAFGRDWRLPIVNRFQPRVQEPSA